MLTAVGSSAAVSSGLGACCCLSAIGSRLSVHSFVGRACNHFVLGLTWAWQPADNTFSYSHSLTVSVVFPAPLSLSLSSSPSHTHTHLYCDSHPYSALITDSPVFTAPVSAGFLLLFVKISIFVGWFKWSHCSIPPQSQFCNSGNFVK